MPAVGRTAQSRGWTNESDRSRYLYSGLTDSGLVHAVLLTSSIAKGRIASIDTTAPSAFRACSRSSLIKELETGERSDRTLTRSARRPRAAITSERSSILREPAYRRRGGENIRSRCRSRQDSWRSVIPSRLPPFGWNRAWRRSTLRKYRRQRDDPSREVGEEMSSKGCSSRRSNSRKSIHSVSHPFADGATFDHRRVGRLRQADPLRYLPGNLRRSETRGRAPRPEPENVRVVSLLWAADSAARVQRGSRMRPSLLPDSSYC